MELVIRVAWVPAVGTSDLDMITEADLTRGNFYELYSGCLFQERVRERQVNCPGNWEAQIVDYLDPFKEANEFTYAQSRADLFQFTGKLKLHKWFALKGNRPPERLTENSRLSDLSTGDMDVLYILSELESDRSQSVDEMVK
ncbi:hypothetical protein NDU88_001534 [Pleurodeles waltl]|uniref:Uncharacterized protein n=1 Tax=Pleurodeles waltl TaxID=8319 RepID=A0AAV7KRQ6_PLEWA|nr:hypothetical protein NDU88_001534 [Pleurodeles waltl]